MTDHPRTIPEFVDREIAREVENRRLGLVYRPQSCELCRRDLFRGAHLHESDGTRG